MLAALRITGQQQDAGAGCEDEQHADQRFLLLRSAALGPGQQQSAEQRRADGSSLHRHPARGQPERHCGDHAQAGDLRDRQVDKDDAALEHLRTERHVGGQHQQPGEQRRPEDADIERVPVQDHGLAPAPAAASRRATVSSNRPNRSFAASLPPTVNGSFTTGIPEFLESHSEARASW